MLIKDEVRNWLKDTKIDFIKDYDLSKKSWIRAGGVIENVITPSNLEQLKKILEFLNKKELNFYVFGNLSNTLIRDGIIKSPFINLKKFDKIEPTISKDNLLLKVGAGVPIPRFSQYLMKQSFSDFEGLQGIPGSIGGGIFMNSSCYGYELTKYVKEIISIDLSGKILKRKKDEALFDWRSSIYQKNKEIIISIIFEVPMSCKKDKNLIKLKSEKIRYHRKQTQESDFPNLGSLFATKNLYSDIKFVSFEYFKLFLYNKFFLILINNGIIKSLTLLNFRKKINKKYQIILQIDERENFCLSEKTINCLVNKGNSSANNAINLIKKLKVMIKNKVNLENIILENIE